MPNDSLPDSPIRLVCLDVDGTLVGADGGVRPAVWDAVARVKAAGVLVALCSGRPGFGVTRQLAERVDATGWHVFQNGASVVHLGSGASRSSPLTPESVAMLVARARADGLDLELYADGDYVCESRSELARKHAGLLGLPFEPRPLASLQGPAVRAQWLLPHDGAELVIAQPHPGLEVSPSLSPVMPEAQFVNLTRAGVDKGSAVRTLAGEYGVPLEQVMYVGDGRNDAPAMRIVGFPVAMANAEHEAIAVARRVVGHVDADGAVEALALVA